MKQEAGQKWEVKFPKDNYENLLDASRKALKFLIDEGYFEDIPEVDNLSKAISKAS